MGLEAGNVFSHKGANVVLVARNSAKLEKAVDYISVCVSFITPQHNTHNSTHVLTPPRNLHQIPKNSASTGSART